MSGYDFSLLSPVDFEELCRDLLQRRLRVELQSFTKGRDGGIDLRHAPVLGCNWVVQCKHFSGSTFSTLKSKLKTEELPKLARLSPDRYILATSLALTPSRIDELFALLQPHCKSPHDIVSKDDLNGLLRDYPEVEQSHFKLWITSEPILSRILHNDLFVQSAITHEQIGRRIALYVQTESLQQARKKLDKERVCILSGVPGVGKTTLAEMLLLQYIAKDWQLVAIHQNVSEGLRAFQQNPKAKQIFYYDDFLGQISSGEKLAKNEDQVLLKLMSSVAATPRKRFVLTTREYILAQAKAEHERLARSSIDLYRFVVSCEEYGEFEKAKILANHLYFYGVPHKHIEALIEGARFRNIISHKNYSPRIVEWMTGPAETSACKAAEYPAIFVARLDNPTRLWEHAFEKQLSESSRQLLFLLAACGDAAFSHELEPAFEAYYSKRSASLHVARTSNDYRDSLNELEGNFVRIHADTGRRIIQFHNPSIIDYLKSELRSRPRDIEALLDNAAYFSMVERLSLLFGLGIGETTKEVLLQEEIVTILSNALRRTIASPSIAVTAAENSRGKWVHVWRNRWERLRDCILIGTRFAHDRLRECVIDVVGRCIDQYCESSGGELEELIGIIERVSNVSWWSKVEVARLQHAMKNLLLSSTDDFEETLDGLSAVASWVTESTEIFSDTEAASLVDAISLAVTKEVESELSENDPQRLGGDLEAVEGIAKTLGRSFEQEVRWLNEAISECGPPPDEETPDDWSVNDSRGSCQSSIESLFDSLLQ